MKRVNSPLYSLKFWLLCISSFLFFTSFNLIIPELPDYLTSLGGGAHKGLIIPLFTLMAGLSRPFSGRLTDTVGRVPVMIYGVVVCILAGFAYPLMATVAGFFFLRLLHGMSTGFKPTATAAYVADIAPVARRGEAMGVLGMFGSLGMAMGPAIGSWIASIWGYEMMFWASSGFAVLSVAVVMRMPETLPVRQPFQWKLLKISRREVLEPRVFPSAVVMLLTTFSFGTVLTLIPDMSGQLGLTNKGVFFSVFTVSSISIRFLAGRLSDAYGRVPVLMGGCFLYFVSMLLTGFADSPQSFYAASVLFGMALGITSPTIFAWTVDLADRGHSGRALATMFIALEVGIGVGGVVSGYSYGNEPSNLPISFTISAILSLLAAAYLYRYQRRQLSRRRGQ